MSHTTFIPAPDAFTTFGALLMFLRKRARLTQEELGRATGYSRAHIARLESNQRAPDLNALTALFLPALDVRDVPTLAARLLELAHATRITVTRTVTESVTVAFDSAPPPTPPLPAPLLALIGRDSELTTLGEMLAHPGIRLITMVGPPGVGKTRTALEAAWRHFSLFRDGVTWVELAPITAVHALAPAILAALALPESGHTDPRHRLRDYLQPQHRLLVLDNFEQLIAAAPLVATLLQSAPHLKILITSRVPLQLYGEHEFAVAPFAIPTGDDEEPSPVVALFVARAKAVNPTFALTPDTLPLVETICRQLDGLPLAVELAAAQIRTVPLQRLAERLGQRLTTLDAAPRGGHPHTLREAIATSYTRLPADAQRLFRAMGVLNGGFTSEAALLFGSDAALQTLVTANLVRVVGEAEGTYRFGMLETLREYALEALDAAGEGDGVRQCLARYYRDLLTQAEGAFRSGTLPQWQSTITAERTNLRTTMAWTLDHAPDIGIDIAALLYHWYHLWGEYHDLIGWLEQFTALDLPATPARALAFRGLGVMRHRAALHEQAVSALETAIALYDHLGDVQALAAVAVDLASVYEVLGRYAPALAWVERAIAAFRAAEDAVGESWALSQIGTLLEMQRAFEEALPYFEKAVAIARTTPDHRHLAWMLSLLGDGLRDMGRVADAAPIYNEAHHYFEAAGVTTGIVFVHMRQGGALLQVGNLEEAALRLQTALQLGQESQTLSYYAQALALMGIIAIRRGDDAAGVCAIAAAHARYDYLRQRLLVPDLLALDAALAHARTTLGDAAFQAATDAGACDNCPPFAHQYPRALPPTTHRTSPADTPTQG